MNIIFSLSLSLYIKYLQNSFHDYIYDKFNIK